MSDKKSNLSGLEVSFNTSSFAPISFLSAVLIMWHLLCHNYLILLLLRGMYFLMVGDVYTWCQHLVFGLLTCYRDSKLLLSNLHFLLGGSYLLSNSLFWNTVPSLPIFLLILWGLFNIFFVYFFRQHWNKLLRGECSGGLYDDTVKIWKLCMFLIMLQSSKSGVASS